MFYFRVHPALEEMTVLPANQDLRYVSVCLLYLVAVNRASYITLLFFREKLGLVDSLVPMVILVIRYEETTELCSHSPLSLSSLLT